MTCNIYWFSREDVLGQLHDCDINNLVTLRVNGSIYPVGECLTPPVIPQGDEL